VAFDDGIVHFAARQQLGDGMAHQFADAQLTLRLAGRARAFALGFLAS
jgi:hypothetical protein